MSKLLSGVEKVVFRTPNKMNWIFCYYGGEKAVYNPQNGVLIYPAKSAKYVNFVFGQFVLNCKENKDAEQICKALLEWPGFRSEVFIEHEEAEKRISVCNGFKFNNRLERNYFEQTGISKYGVPCKDDEVKQEENIQETIPGELDETEKKKSRKYVRKMQTKPVKMEV